MSALIDFPPLPSARSLTGHPLLLFTLGLSLCSFSSFFVFFFVFPFWVSLGLHYGFRRRLFRGGRPRPENVELEGVGSSARSAASSRRRLRIPPAAVAGRKTTVDTRIVNIARRIMVLRHQASCVMKNTSCPRLGRPEQFVR